MTKAQLTEALKLAKSGADFPQLSVSSIFFGYGEPDFKPVYCTLKDIAGLLRWQVINMDGSIDNTELNLLANAGRKKFLIVG